MNRNSKGVLALANAYMKKDVVAEDLNQAYAQISELAKTSTKKASREAMAELIGYVVDSVVNQNLSWLDLVADVKRVGEGDKAEFKIKYEGISAKIAAKGSTPEISQIKYKREIIPTVEVQARPSVNYREMVNNPEEIMTVIDDAVIKMENQMVSYVQTVLNAAYAALSAPNYASGAGLVKTTLDPQVYTMARFGKPAIIGDIEVIAGLTALTGFNSNVADELSIEHNNNGFIGTYIGGNVVKINNRYADDSSLDNANLVLDYDKLYIVPAGARETRPLKVVFEGGVRAMEQTNAEDESWELFLRMDFGVGVIGIQKLMAVYENTSL